MLGLTFEHSIKLSGNIFFMEALQSIESLDPKKFYVLTKNQKLVATIAISFAIFVAAPILLFFYYKFAVTRPSQTANEITYEIHGGASIDEISRELADIGAINSAALFKLYLVINDLQDKIQAGVYVIPAGTSVARLATQFQHGVNDIKITFVEGWRLEEIALLATQKLKHVGYEGLVTAAAKYEGYLFPDTYFFNSDVSEVGLIEKLTKNFRAKTEDILTEAALGKVGLTEKEVVILASIVEREVSAKEDRSIVAGILIDRYKEGGRLDADATTQYVKATRYICSGPEQIVCPNEEQAKVADWWPKVLLQHDLDAKSPYNTRMSAGLPPSSISNPGLSTIVAVLNPTKSEYRYYLTDKDGVTHYAKTLDEHNSNIRKYL